MALAVSTNSSLELEVLARRRSRILLFGNVQAVAHRGLSHGDTTFAESADRKFGLERRPNFSNDDDVERHPEYASDFVSDNDSPAGQTQHHFGIVVRSCDEAKPELPSRVGSIIEPLHTLGLAASSASSRRPRLATAWRPRRNLYLMLDRSRARVGRGRTGLMDKITGKGVTLTVSRSATRMKESARVALDPAHRRKNG